MNVLIMNGSKTDSGINSCTSEIINKLSTQGHSVKELMLRDMNYNPCRGCFNCWVKTPGLCVYKDDGDILCKEFLNSDLVILASPIIMGYPSAIVKNALDRIIPLIHPYLEDVNGEVHHKKRYKKYPSLALILEKGEDTDAEDIEIITEIFERSALNLQSSLKFVKLTDSAAEEMVNEIISH